MYRRTYLIFLSLSRPAESAAAERTADVVTFGEHQGATPKFQMTVRLPTDPLSQVVSYLSEAELLKTFMRGPEFDEVFQEIQKSADLPNREYFVKANRPEINAGVNLAWLLVSWIAEES